LTDNFTPSTLVVVNSATSTDQVDPSSTPPAPVQASSSGTGFWNNKGAVGGTFTVVSLVILGAIVFLAANFVKRVRRNRARKLDEELYGNLFEPDHSRPASSHDARSLTYSTVDPFAASEVVQVRNGGAPLPTTGGTSNGPSAFMNAGYAGSNDSHTSSNDHSSSNYHGFNSISYHTGGPNSRGNFTQPEPPRFYLPPSVSMQRHPYNNFTALPQSTSTIPLAYNSPGVGLDAYHAGQLRSYYHAGTTEPPGVPAGRAF